MLVAHLCWSLWEPHGPPGSSLHGILQARTLLWVVIPFSRESSWPRNQSQVSCIRGRFFTVWVTREVCVCLQVCICLLSPDLEWEGWMSFRIGLKHVSAHRKHTHTLQLRLLTRLGTHGTASNLVPLSPVSPVTQSTEGYCEDQMRWQR